jgi:hypothetical protein
MELFPPIPYAGWSNTIATLHRFATSFEQDRWRRATRYVRLRADLHPADVPVLGSPA